MIPILYTANETDFSHCGIGALSEMTSCTVTEERNGAFECEFKYPVDGKLFAEIQESRIVKAKPNASIARQTSFSGTRRRAPSSTVIPPASAM